MKKIVLALALFSLLFSVQVLAATYTKGTESTNKFVIDRKASAKCVVSVLDERDRTIIDAFYKKNEIIIAALKQRHEAMLKAYTLGTNAEINKAIINAQTNFKNTRSKANLEYQKTAKNIWLKFNTSRKKCGNLLPQEPTVNGQNLDFAL
ncbi:MAG: hypothetical protein WCJ57_02905 [Candidatus Falkowbacteria bacterium]